MAASVGEIVRAVSELRGTSAAAATEIAGELGLDLAAVRGRAVRGLSGGMRQKLLLALALATPADLLILDEPTASLDAAARGRFLARFAALDPRATVVLCSHRLDELRTLVDHVVALADGRIAYDGPADAYLARQLAAVVEVRYRGGDPAWLVDHGFVRGANGWWSRAVTPTDKRELVGAAFVALGTELEDVIVRDADRLEVTRDAA
jgi:ABC-type multidrug transport system ATPase subunit